MISHWSLHTSSRLEDPEVIDSTVEGLSRQMIELAKYLSSDQLPTSLLNSYKLQTPRNRGENTSHPVRHSHSKLGLYPKTFSWQTRLGQQYLRLKVLFEAAEMPNIRHFCIETTDPDIYIVISSKSTRQSSLVQMMPPQKATTASLKSALEKFLNRNTTKAAQARSLATGSSHLWLPMLCSSEYVDVPRNVAKELNKCFDFGSEATDLIQTVSEL